SGTYTINASVKYTNPNLNTYTLQEQAPANVDVGKLFVTNIEEFFMIVRNIQPPPPDETPPWYTQSFDDSNGEVGEGTIVNVSVYWKDNVQLDKAIFRHNASGVWQNISTCSLTSNESWCNKTIDTTGYAGKTICWNMYANDTAGNWNKSMPETLHCFNVLLDTIPPTIVLNFPDNNYNTTSTAINFNFSATDSNSENLTCNITVNGIVVAENLIATNATPYNKTVSSLDLGTSFWNVTCKDQAGNTNTSVTRFFTIITYPKNFNISLHSDGSTLILRWSAVEGATNYEIFITSDYFSGFPTSPNITTNKTSYNDTTAGTVAKRFYEIQAIRGSAVKRSNVTVAKYEKQLQLGWNLVSLPLNLTHKHLGPLSSYPDPLPTNPTNSIVAVYRLIPGTETWERCDHSSTGWYQAAGSENFTTLNETEGYWLETNSSTSVIFVGSVFKSNTTVELAENWNLIGWSSIQDATLPTGGEPPAYPFTCSPSNAIRRLYRYNGTSFEMTNHFDNWGWYPADNTPLFTSINKTEGYYVKVIPSTNWTLEALK
ncbi:hypothetical protein KY318_01560, partial [Candidatus Woesearchaeota archaeon]|nr:hypothetical protein [Candidatus Woesearchaeota archaeon]